MTLQDTQVKEVGKFKDAGDIEYAHPQSQLGVPLLGLAPQLIFVPQKIDVKPSLPYAVQANEPLQK